MDDQNTSKGGRDDSVRAVEEKARRRKQVEVQNLRDKLDRIHREDYQRFLSEVGDIPKYANSQLVEWQVISIAARAIE
jgi:hypothetical protein